MGKFAKRETRGREATRAHIPPCKGQGRGESLANEGERESLEEVRESHDPEKSQNPRSFPPAERTREVRLENHPVDGTTGKSLVTLWGAVSMEEKGQDPDERMESQSL